MLLFPVWAYLNALSHSHPVLNQLEDQSMLWPQQGLSHQTTTSELL